MFARKLVWPRVSLKVLQIMITGKRDTDFRWSRKGAVDKLWNF